MSRGTPPEEDKHSKGTAGWSERQKAVSSGSAGQLAALATGRAREGEAVTQRPAQYIEAGQPQAPRVTEAGLGPERQALGLGMALATEASTRPRCWGKSRPYSHPRSQRGHKAVWKQAGPVEDPRE